MAVTKIADVVVPEVFNDYFREESIYKSALVRSGILAINPKMTENLAGGSSKFSTPFWKSNDIIDDVATPVVEDATLTPGSIGSGQMDVRRQFREKSWGKNDVATVLAGSDPGQAILDLTEQFWFRNYQLMLFASVRGVIADNQANDGSDMINDITAEVGPADLISSSAIIATQALTGDQGPQSLTAIAMHSVPYYQLVDDNVIDFVADSEQDMGFGTYMGKSVIVDDMLVDGTDYYTILFKAGAFGFAQNFGDAYEATEVERKPEISGGQEVYYTRRVFTIHPLGFSWNEVGVADEFPTDADLVDPLEWNRVAASVKNTGFVVLKSNG